MAITDREVHDQGHPFSTFEKMLPMEAFELFEDLRAGLEPMAPAIAVLIGSADVLDDAGNFRIEKAKVHAIAPAVSLLAKFPKETIAIAKARLFQFVTFKSAKVPTPAKISASPGDAFDGLNFTHIYEILGRALAVNFTESLAELLSPYIALVGSASPPSSTETSPPSSPTP